MGKLLYLLLFGAIVYFFVFPYILEKHPPGLPPPSKPPPVAWLKAAAGTQRQFNEVSAQLNAGAGSGRGGRVPPQGIPNPAEVKLELQRAQEAITVFPTTQPTPR